MKWVSQSPMFRSLNDDYDEFVKFGERSHGISDDVTVGTVRMWHPVTRIAFLTRMLEEARAQGGDA